MNKFSMAKLFQGLALGSLAVFVTPSWADDHLLSVNGATVTQNMVITDAGAITTPLTLSNFDGNPTLTLGQSQTVTVVKALVKLCKPGTKGQLEWLDQGNTIVGVTGAVTSGNSSAVPINGYRLTLTMTGISNTYGSSNGACSVSGQKTFTFTPGAVIAKQIGNSGNFNTILTTTYNFWNAINTAPEPGTAVLMLMGLLVLGWLNYKRTRGLRAASA